VAYQDGLVYQDDPAAACRDALVADCRAAVAACLDAAAVLGWDEAVAGVAVADRAGDAAAAADASSNFHADTKAARNNSGPSSRRC
jgi:hypothetical protein